MAYVVAAPEIVSLPVTGSADRFPVRRVFCVGRNYEAHAKEMGFTGREPPFFFLKPAQSVVAVPAGTVGEIAYPSLTKDLHHEIELVVAIGKGGRTIAVADAAKHIYGYAIGLDMTRRDLQGEMKKQGRPWCIGKAFDQAAPIGPVTPIAQCGELTRGAISLAVNGAPRQASDVSMLIWSVDEVIAHLSAAWALAPGDLVMTGTPEGVAAVVRGDRMHGEIAGLGALDVVVR
ncbi:MAG: fumarylacetoacetate hydrolase family protein [Burkholderiaceae bacterium]|nr:fumarylacetoacetate hydrolase family protein [Burkholderiaceae bacterium]MEB2351633.1 fumarylacetoacetate hydrolase family protein [Burkholderiaceae bacterium]